MGPSAKAELAERRAIIRAERQPEATFSALNKLHDPPAGGRFAKADYIVGEEQVPTYPAGPAWGRDHSGIEPPLNLDINALEPCGEPFEVQRSIAQLGGSIAAPAISIPDGSATATVSSSPAAAERRDATSSDELTSFSPGDVRDADGVAIPSASEARLALIKRAAEKRNAEATRQAELLPKIAVRRRRLG
jgi:hypothetical protein